LCIAALLFAVSATITIGWCASMATMGEMAMPGGWTMSMAWMRMPGQSWFGAAAAFLGMWLVMMVAMMLPSLTPMLLRYRSTFGTTDERYASRLAAWVGAGYFAVWTLFGVVAYALGSALATLEMHQPALARAMPIAAGIVILIAGALQFSRWKARHLACCREVPVSGSARTPTVAAAWGQGLRFGLHCSYCCVGLTTILLAIGVMDVRAMACVTAAITAERLAPNGARVARAVGIVVIGGGLLTIVQAIAAN
jgi:predicted metal-binding membrane protein